MTLDQLCSSIAARQLGLITRAQALAAGQSAHAIARRLTAGCWEVAMPSVYALAGTPDTWERRALAAQLWAGTRAALSHLTAATLLGLWDRRPSRIDVTTTRRIQASGVTVRRSALMASDVQRLGPFTVTTALRTLVDLAAVMDEGRLEDCLEEALFRRLTDLHSLLEHLQAALRGTKGAPVLRRLVEMRDPLWQPTESDLETLLFRTSRRANLPLPERQYRVYDNGSIVARLDFAYPEHRLAVPADSYRWHGSRRGWDNDIRTRNTLVRLSWRIRATTWTELKRSPDRFIRDIAFLLGRHELWSFQDENRPQISTGQSFAPTRIPLAVLPGPAAPTA